MGRGWKAARAKLASHFCAHGMPIDYPDAAPCKEESSTFQDSTSRSSISPSASIKGTCSICLDPMKAGARRALFTAECSHMFHFSCIASNVKHGSLVCPVCRAKWLDVPWKQEQMVMDKFPRRRFYTPGLFPPAEHDVDPVLRILNDSIANAQRSRRSLEPELYDDDEECAASTSTTEPPVSSLEAEGASRMPKVSAFPEAASVSAAEPRDDFTVLVNIKAPVARLSGRAPIDLVTVLDVSGSMAGSKMALLKSAMEFVIGQLNERDRLCVISFSSSATRVFPLKRMDEDGKALALRGIRSLSACGGTNIRDGLRKAMKVLRDKRYKNSVSSIMLLSDGQDTSAGSLLFSASREASAGNPPVHAFGFGSDHDPSMLHAIAESSGGTFSFIRAESSVQNAFAQCIGGLLSVVSQGVEVTISWNCGGGLKVEQGGFESRVSDDGREAVVELGDLYAEEERDILVQGTLGTSASPCESLQVGTMSCKYRDPLNPGEVLTTETFVLNISRPAVVENNKPSIVVDRQRNRLICSQAISRSRSLADAGDLNGAQAVITEARNKIEKSAAFAAGDGLAKSLHGELKEVQTRMHNRRVYEETGRAFALSAYSSHNMQRATVREGDTSGSYYQTSSMAEMVQLSQTFTCSTDNSGLARKASGSGIKEAAAPAGFRIGRSKSSRKVIPNPS